MTPGVISDGVAREIAPGVLVRLATVLAVFTYFYGLDSQHIPKNGDEYPLRAHHADDRGERALAAASVRIAGHAQHQTAAAVLAGHRIHELGKRLDAVAPAMAERDLHAAHCRPGVPASAGRLSHRLDTGLIALLTFLAFFSTYRYGRPFLTDAPSVFWLFVPLAALLICANTYPGVATDCFRPAGNHHRRRTALPIVCVAAAGRALSCVVAFAPTPVQRGSIPRARCGQAHRPRHRGIGDVQPVVRARSRSARDRQRIHPRGERRQVRSVRGLPEKFSSGADPASGGWWSRIR